MEEEEEGEEGGGEALSSARGEGRIRGSRPELCSPHVSWGSGFLLCRVSPAFLLLILFLSSLPLFLSSPALNTCNNMHGKCMRHACMTSAHATYTYTQHAIYKTCV